MLQREVSVSRIWGWGNRVVSGVLLPFSSITYPSAPLYSGITLTASPTAGGVNSNKQRPHLPPNHWGRNGGDWGQSALRRSYVYGWKVLAGVVGFRGKNKSIKINVIDGFSRCTVDQKVYGLRNVANPLPIKSCDALGHQETSYCFRPRGGSEHRQT